MNRKFANLDADNKIVYAPDGVVYEGRYHTRPTEVMYRANGFYPLVEETPEKVGVTFVATSYGDIVDGVIRRRYDETPIVPPAPPVIRYSKLKLITAAKRIGKWDALKAWINSAGIMDEWLVCQYLASNYEGFDEIKAAVVAAGVATAEEVEAILAASVDEEVR